MQTPHAKRRTGNLGCSKSRTQGTFCQAAELERSQGHSPTKLWRIEGKNALQRIEGMSLSSNRKQEGPQNLLCQLLDAQIASLRNCSKIKQALIRQSKYIPYNKLVKNQRKASTPYKKGNRVVMRNARPRDASKDNAVVKERRSSIALLSENVGRAVKPKAINNCLKITNKKYFERPSKNTPFTLVPQLLQGEAASEESKGLNYRTVNTAGECRRTSQSGRQSANNKHRPSTQGRPCNVESSTHSLSDPLPHSLCKKHHSLLRSDEDVSSLKEPFYLRQTMDSQLFCREKSKETGKITSSVVCKLREERTVDSTLTQSNKYKVKVCCIQ